MINGEHFLSSRQGQVGSSPILSFMRFLKIEYLNPVSRLLKVTNNDDKPNDPLISATKPDSNIEFLK